MRRVMVTIGPQCAGKSTFCRAVIDAYPDVVLVSRDDILTKMFGSPYLSPYYGHHAEGMKRMWQIVGEELRKKPHVTLILDAWNDSSSCRRGMVGKLICAGADRIDGWYFVTPLATAIRWVFKRHPIPVKNDWSIRRRKGVIRDYVGAYRAYHADLIGQEGHFASIRRIDARELMPLDILDILEPPPVG